MSTERPILFGAPMVRAILAGRKTQTRRILKSNLGKVPPSHVNSEPRDPAGDGRRAWWVEPGGWVRCPYDAQRLWVRESWGYRGGGWNNQRPKVEEITIGYQADDSTLRFVRPVGAIEALSRTSPERRPGESGEDFDARLTRWWRSWRPSIHLPRWASRLTLDVLSVRVERLHDISEEDARAEGVTLPEGIGADQRLPRLGWRYGDAPHRFAFALLWSEINGQESLEANPWTWAIGFQLAARSEVPHAR